MNANSGTGKVAVHRWFESGESWAAHPWFDGREPLYDVLKPQLQGADGPFCVPGLGGLLIGEKVPDPDCPDPKARARHPTICALFWFPKSRPRHSATIWCGNFASCRCRPHRAPTPASKSRCRPAGRHADPCPDRGDCSGCRGRQALLAQGAGHRHALRCRIAAGRRWRPLLRGVALLRPPRQWSPAIAVATDHFDRARAGRDRFVRGRLDAGARRGALSQ